MSSDSDARTAHPRTHLARRRGRHRGQCRRSTSRRASSSPSSGPTAPARPRCSTCLRPAPADRRPRHAGRRATSPRLAPHRRARLGLGRTFQSSSVFGSLTRAPRTSRLAVQARGGGSMRLWRRRGRPIGGGRGGRGARPGRPGRPASALAGTLAHGEKRKLEIALLLAGRAAGDAAGRADGRGQRRGRAGAGRADPRPDPRRAGTACSWWSTTWTWCSTWPTGSP